MTSASTEGRGRASAAHLAVALACAGVSVSPWGSPPLALTLGILLGLTVGSPMPAASKRISTLLLRGSVVLLGFTMDLRLLLDVGVQGAWLAAATIVAVMVLGVLSARLLGVDPRTSALVSSGTAICGGSAIAAVGSVIGATTAEMSVAIGTVFLLNASALYLFPVIGHALALTQTQFGEWAGMAIHDISSVVGASSRYGLAALQTATAVKLARTLWIAPVAMCLGWWWGRRSEEGQPTGQASRIPGGFPWFIALFVAASAFRAAAPGFVGAYGAAGWLARTGMTLTLFLIGSGLTRSALRSVGWRALLQGILLWAAVSAISLAAIRGFGP